MLGLKRLLKILKGVDIDIEVPPATYSEETKVLGYGFRMLLEHCVWWIMKYRT